MRLAILNFAALFIISALPVPQANAEPVYCEYHPYWPGCPKFCETHPEDWECQKTNGIQHLLDSAQFGPEVRTTAH
jgi:hypothetical protein